MNQINKEIKDNPEFFNELLKEEKIVLSNTIHLSNKRNNAMWKLGQSLVRHKTIDEEIVLIVEKSRRESKYGVKLRCTSLTADPFFRFDSDGPAHRNDFPEIALEKQMVTTPHFNTYKENGQPFAYKNDTLNDSKKAEVVISDLNSGVLLFCIESNCILISGDFPTVVDLEPEFEFEPAKNINLDQITFD